ncbi:hypothetical protein C8J56DRAFT_1159808 [Mycena floridula]|nr:hypothetical protein C8J56DRAFT_1159808 [Mycena floridula]
MRFNSLIIASVLATTSLAVKETTLVKYKPKSGDSGSSSSALTPYDGGRPPTPDQYAGFNRLASYGPPAQANHGPVSYASVGPATYARTDINYIPGTRSKERALVVAAKPGPVVPAGGSSSQYDDYYSDNGRERLALPAPPSPEPPRGERSRTERSHDEHRSSRKSSGKSSGKSKTNKASSSSSTKKSKSGKSELTGRTKWRRSMRTVQRRSPVAASPKQSVALVGARDLNKLADLIARRYEHLQDLTRRHFDQDLELFARGN